MAQQGWNQTLVSQRGAGTLFNTYTTAKTVLNPQSLYVIPPGFFYDHGPTGPKKLRIRIQGAISNRVTGPDTTTFQVMLGPAGSIVVFTTGAITLTTTAHTEIPFWCDIDLICRAVGNGTTANLAGQARISGQMIQQSGTAGADSLSGCTAMYPNTTPAVGGGFDSTVANILDFWVAQSVSNAANGIRISEYEVIDCN